MSATEAEWRERNGIDPDAPVSLMGEWWWVGDVDGCPEYMIWAGGRDLYDDTIKRAQERFGVAPITVPLNAFFPPPPTEEPQE